MRWALVVLVACSGTPRSDTQHQNREVTNLHAFAVLYGVVRWFHPSDEAAVIDWDRYAITGIDAVRGARDARQLEAALEAWLQPIAPSVDVLHPGEAAKPRAIDPNAPQVAWQYMGPGFDGGQSVYQGKRTNRIGRATQGGWGAFSQAIDAAPLRGRTVRIHARLAAGPRSSVGAWLRVDLANSAKGFFDNMMDRAVTAPTWTDATVSGPVAPTAEKVIVGGIVMGEQGRFDSFVLEVADASGGWSQVPLVNATFDDGTNGWSSKASGFEFIAVEAAGRLTASSREITEDLFAEKPAAGDVAELDLGDGLRARVPLSLVSASDHTMPAGDLAAANARIAATKDTNAKIADVIVAWNVLQHFYPYHDVLARPWGEALDRTILDAMTATDHGDVLRRLVAAIEDGHGSVTAGKPRVALPLWFGFVENKLVVLASGVDGIARGDVIEAFDGTPAGRALERETALASGSPQWRTDSALRKLGAGERDTFVSIQLARGATVRVQRTGNTPPLYTYSAMSEMRPGFWVVDMSRADEADMKKTIDALAAAKGVVFDMRGYPRGNHFILAHLLPARETDRWMHVEKRIRPRPAPPAAWESFGWDMEPAEPKLRGKVVFVTGPGAISYAESVMGYVEAVKLPIVGEATAGTNGNVRTVRLPSGAQFTFTGMKVTRHDGARSHLEGIRPTVRATPTLAGIRAGKDEVLERALDLAAH